MTIINFQQQIKEDTAFLSSFKDEQILFFSKGCLAFISGSKEEVQKLGQLEGISSQALECGLVGLSKIFVDAAKMKLSKDEFKISVMDMNFTEAQVHILAEFYIAHKEIFFDSKQQSEASSGIQEFKDLEWRLDIELGRRMLRNEVNPLFNLRLDLQEQSNPLQDQLSKHKSIFLSSDYANMKHLQDQLERAVAEVKSTHCNRISRYIR